MKTLWKLSIFSLAIASAPMFRDSSAIASTLFQATIDVEQEVCSKVGEPCPTESNAIGFFTAELNDAEDALKYTFEINGLDLGSAIGQSQTADPGDDVFKVHIHFAPPNVAGPVVFAPLDRTMEMPSDDADDLKITPFQNSVGGTIGGVWEQTDGTGGAIATTLAAQLANLKSGQLYGNIHSYRFLANGELRGQITNISEPTTTPEPTMLLGLAFAGTMGLFLRQRQQNVNRPH